MKVSALYIYPIKSLPGIAVPSADVLQKGFRYDRRWMLIDENQVAITQRTRTQLSQVKISMKGNRMSLQYAGLDDLEIPLVIEDGDSIDATVWGDTVQSLEAAPHVHEWFSQVLEEPAKLVFMPEHAERPVDAKHSDGREHVSFADGYPYLIISEASLADLNGRVEKALPMNRFRPNIVVTGCDAYAEDTWKDITIGKVKFQVTHPCKRCVFTTVDQETGKKGVEPLKTLATYRREGNDVIFGVNTLAKERGTIQVGDFITLID